MALRVVIYLVLPFGQTLGQPLRRLTFATLLNYTVMLVITAFDKERTAAVILTITVMSSFLLIRLDLLALRGVDEILEKVIISVSDIAVLLHRLLGFTIRNNLVNFSVLVANLFNVFLVGITVFTIDYNLMCTFNIADSLRFHLIMIVIGVAVIIMIVIVVVIRFMI